MELATISLAPHPINSSAHVYDMDVKAERERCIVQLWKPCGLEEAKGSLVAANCELAAMLRACTANGYRPPDPEAYAARREMRLESTLADLTRDRNQKLVPIWTAALSVACSKNQLKGSLWNVLCSMHRGALMGNEWTEKIICEAEDLRPPPGETMIKQVGFIHRF